MPGGAVYVGRGSRWGNPYRVSAAVPASESVEMFRDLLARAPRAVDGGTVYMDIKRALHGKDLACWCPLDQPCHADVLIEVANPGAGVSDGA